MRKLVIVLGALGIALFADVAAANADSIVYMKSGAVWISNADGSSARPFTLYPFHWAWPSEADDGTIVAAGGDGHPPYGEAGSDLYRFSANGNLTAGPIPTPGTYYTLNCPTQAPNSVRVSPDAGKIAYGTTLCSQGPTALWTPSNATGLDWPNQNGGLGVQDYDYPDWIDSTVFTVTHPGPVSGTQSQWGVSSTAASPGGAGWYEPGATGTGFQAIVARSGKISALFEDDKADWIPPQTHNATIRLYTAASLTDAENNGFDLQCKLTLSASQSSDPFDFSPTFSPDGTKLLWGDDLGVEVANVADLSASSGACTHVTPTLLIPGGSQPFYAAGNMQAQAASPAQPGAPAAPTAPTTPTTATGTTTPSTATGTGATSTKTKPRPTARIAVGTKHPRAHHAIVFNAGASRVHGHATYSWGFGDHHTAKGRRVTHRFGRPGRYTVTLTVHDANGTRTTHVKVTVKR